jgi:hypothetical protein
MFLKECDMCAYDNDFPKIHYNMWALIEDIYILFIAHPERNKW